MNDAVARNGDVVALQHHVPNGARGAGPAREQCDEAVARDAPAWDVANDRVHARSPVR